MFRQVEHIHLNGNKLLFNACVHHFYPWIISLIHIIPIIIPLSIDASTYSLMKLNSGNLMEESEQKTKIMQIFL